MKQDILGCQIGTVSSSKSDPEDRSVGESELELQGGNRRCLVAPRAQRCLISNLFTGL